jgi:hypothetical protein
LYESSTNVRKENPILKKTFHFFFSSPTPPKDPKPETRLRLLTCMKMTELDV